MNSPYNWCQIIPANDVRCTGYSTLKIIYLQYDTYWALHSSLFLVYVRTFLVVHGIAVLSAALYQGLLEAYLLVVPPWLYFDCSYPTYPIISKSISVIHPKLSCLSDDDVHIMTYKPSETLLCLIAFYSAAMIEYCFLSC